jgi:hypothetical protein
MCTSLIKGFVGETAVIQFHHFAHISHRSLASHFSGSSMIKGSGTFDTNS